LRISEAISKFDAIDKKILHGKFIESVCKEPYF
jgi:hypothetical protein